jgi:hypothetical protein
MGGTLLRVCGVLALMLSKVEWTRNVRESVGGGSSPRRGWDKPMVEGEYQ